ncbi:MAG TPA: hypothetical protein VEJ86_12960 [Candidatus Binataceae bacterium]|nr:hypothetical protein [Candidatus Binataceae bacterium]
MKRFALGVLVGFLASWTAAIAAPTVAHNGTFWNKLNASAKDGYVNGYSDAMKASVTQIDSLNTAADMFHWKGARQIIRQLTSQLAVANLTSQEAVKRLDELYANQHYSDLDLDEALQMLTIRAHSTAMPAPETLHQAAN